MHLSNQKKFKLPCITIFVVNNFSLPKKMIKALFSPTTIINDTNNKL